jgi:hypothetical protein
MGSTIETRSPFVQVWIADAYAFPRLPAPIIRRRGGEGENAGREGAGRRVISDGGGEVAWGAISGVGLWVFLCPGGRL